MSLTKFNGPSVLITGAGGYIGRQVVKTLYGKYRKDLAAIVATDIREPSHQERLEGVNYHTLDIRSPGLQGIMEKHHVDTVVHLAAIVTPGRKPDRKFEYSVDVLGTRNVLDASVGAGVRKVIVTSSGAAYGYYHDNPEPLDEYDALRGNPEFAYSDHKRQVEEMLAAYRENHPGLKQLIFRPGTILGPTADNQITALFDKPLIMGLKGSRSPFVFIWDEDVVACIIKGIWEDVAGIFNMAGDGVVTMREIASLLGKPYISVPVWLVQFALSVLKKLGMTQYGPEQVNFLRYRPVLSNERLKWVFGYIPRKTSREAFESYLREKG
jgi:UDP-glucose 4-epimerase